MADYPSALTGAQMDIALLDVAQHNSEAWAVGTRSGNAVSSGDATYNNNARYYAERARDDISDGVEAAEDAAARAEAAVPAGTAGAVFFDRAQSLTDSQKEQARANIAAGASNRNLLDNWYWGKPINQREITSQDAGTASSPYCIDRWRNARSVVTVNSGYITLNSNSSGYGMVERIELYRMTAGEVYTLSVMMSNGTIYSGSFTYSTTASYIDIGSTSVRGYHQTDTSGEGNVAIWLIPSATGTNVNIKAVKLEKGSYSTLINDTPPNYAEELAKCQYYYREIKCTTTGYAMIGYATAATAFQACLPYVMRVRPTITYSGTLNAYYAGGNSPVTAVAANGEFTNSIQVAFTTSGLTAGSIVALAMGSGAKLMFSADL